MKNHKMISKILSLSILALVAGLSSGCLKGERGEPGDPGAPGAGKIVSTINCHGTVSGVGGPGASDLNGLQVEYSAVLTAGGDVYSTGNVIDELQQVSGTNFYAAGQAGSETANVLVTYDVHGTLDGGVWDINLNRQTLITTAIYDDDSLPAPVTMTFTASACTVLNW